MEAAVSDILKAIFDRRAVKVFDQAPIPDDVRDQLLDAARVAPSSFNIQPYRLYWISSPERRKAAADLCMGQSPAATASALVVAVADLGSWKSTTESHLAWIRTAGFSQEKIAEHERRAKFGKYLFIQGWFNVFGAVKWALLRGVHTVKTVGMAPVSRRGLFAWATKSTSLACQNLMIAAEALGLNTCPMEGFDGARLQKFLGLSPKLHQIVMVIAVGKKSAEHIDQPQWRRPLEATVTYL